MGKCSVCGLEKAVWRNKESGVNLFEGCWEREIKRKLLSHSP